MVASMWSSRSILLLCFLYTAAHAQTESSSAFEILSTITSGGAYETFTGTSYTYASPTSQITAATARPSSAIDQTSTNTLNSTAEVTSSNATQIIVSSTSQSLLQISRLSTSSASINASASSTSSSARPSNTVPCNGFPEFCSRKYSNISNVCSHNSAFVVKNNAASNQMLPITDQLNDGVRMLQGETHYVNNTVYNCHTNCDLLNAGTWQSELETVASWLSTHPYDVVTILIANSDLISVDKFVPAITNAGLLPYVYEPPYIPQYRDQWPTLGDMILRNQRVVFFMDYNANQTAVPYILDQYTHVWETPFSPQDRNFPCTIDRPPGLSQDDAKSKYMYLANHNLNQAVDVSAILGGNYGTILIPNTAELNVTNGQGLELGALGATASNCTADWGFPPTFLVVDYYNIGSPEAGSVFHVAAAANGVTYTRPCCGTTSAGVVFQPSLLTILWALGVTIRLLG